MPSVKSLGYLVRASDKSVSQSNHILCLKHIFDNENGGFSNASGGSKYIDVLQSFHTLDMLVMYNIKLKNASRLIK